LILLLVTAINGIDQAIAIVITLPGQSTKCQP